MSLKSSLPTAFVGREKPASPFSLSPAVAHVPDASERRNSSERIAPDQSPRRADARFLLMLLGLGLALWVAGWIWILLFQNPKNPATLRWGSLGSFLSAGFAAFACLKWARKAQEDAEPHLRGAWLAVGCGSLGFLLGQAFRLYLGTIRGTIPLWPSAADLGLLSQSICFGVACFQIYRMEPTPFPGRAWNSLLVPLISSWDSIRSTEYARKVVDTLLVAVALFTLGWIYFLRPISGAFSSNVAEVIGLAYPLINIAIVSLLVGLMIQRGQGLKTTAVSTLLVGIVTAVAAQLLLASALTSTRRMGLLLPTQRPVEALMVLAFSLVGYAACASRWGKTGMSFLPTSEARIKWQDRLAFYLPYFISIGSCLALVANDLTDSDRQMGAMSLFVISLNLLLLFRRQVVNSFENLDMARCLEDIVGQRTEELRSQANVLAERNAQVEKQAQDLIANRGSLERQTSRLAALHTVTVAANGSLDSQIILRETLKALVKLIPNSWGAAYTVSEDGAELLVPWAHDVASRLRPPQTLPFPIIPTGLASALPREEWSCTFVPLATYGKVHALLMVGILDEGPTEDDLTILDAMGSLIGSALENARLFQETKERADRDPITGLLNHRSLQERLEQEVSRAERDKKPLAVLVMDLNNFKLFNDNYGHPVGDQVLCTVAKALKKICRISDTFGRHGGDEFLAILPNCEADGAIIVADRINEYLAGHGFQIAGEERVIPISCSSGIAIFPHDAGNKEKLLAFADENVYESKRQGGAAVAATQEIRTLRNLSMVDDFDILDQLVWAVDNKDNYTRHHSVEVARYSVWMAEQLGWTEEEIKYLHIAGMLHDVGKIGVPDQILRKPQRLTDEEEKMMREHPLLGSMLVGAIPRMSAILPGVRNHHERWDGKGYPDAMAGEDIPVMGRLMAVPDAFSAMTTDRPYRKAMPLEKAVSILLENIGTQFDGNMVKAFVEGVVPRLQKKVEEKKAHQEEMAARELAGNRR